MRCLTIIFNFAIRLTKKMYTLLHQYLITHKELDLPGIGLLQVLDIPARYTIAEHKLYAPYSTIRCKPERMQTNPKLFTWLSMQLLVSDVEAKQQFNSFIDTILQELTTYKKIIWKGIGLFIKDDVDTIHFTWQYTVQDYLPNIIVQKNLKQSSLQHSTIIQPLSQNKFWDKFWRIWALIIYITYNIAISMYLVLQESINFAMLTQVYKYMLYALFL